MDAAAGAAYSGRRALVTTKQVGMNVMSDSLFYTAYTGAEAALVVVTADDPGLFSSQNEQDNRHYAKLGKFPMLEPCDSQECKDFMGEAVAISERFDTPVVIRTTMRTSHSKSVVELGEPGILWEARWGRSPATWRSITACARGPANAIMCLSNGFWIWKPSATTWPGNAIHWGDREYGFIAGGILYEYVKQVFPEASILKLGMCYPLPKKLIREFADGVQQRHRGRGARPLHRGAGQGYGHPRARQGHLLHLRRTAAGGHRRKLPQGGHPEDTAPAFSDTSESLPSRSPLLCSGCPHRSTFYNLSQMKVPVAGDIGCYNLGTLPPFNAQHTMGAMGASVGVLHGMGLSGLPEPAVCTIGDGTFFHAGVAPLLNMVHNKGKGTVIIMDNRTTAMTGHQDNPGIEATLSLGTVAPVDIAGLCRACGVEKVAHRGCLRSRRRPEGALKSAPPTTGFPCSSRAGTACSSPAAPSPPAWWMPTSASPAASASRAAAPPWCCPTKSTPGPGSARPASNP